LIIIAQRLKGQSGRLHLIFGNVQSSRLGIAAQMADHAGELKAHR
jgi:hypothetical protein